MTAVSSTDKVYQLVESQITEQAIDSFEIPVDKITGAGFVLGCSMMQK